MIKQRVAILGGSGFAGAELYRLLMDHPYFEVVYVSSESRAGKLVERDNYMLRHRNINPDLRYGRIEDLCCVDLVFAALPTGVLPARITEILEKTEVLFNISGDYRFQDEQILSKYYPASISAFKDFGRYVIPEFYDSDFDSRIINLPGCMAVASIYTLLPLIKGHLINKNIVIDVKTGSSGAGKTSKETHAERNNNFRLYRAFDHRHLPEIERIFKNEEEVHEVSFCVYSLDISRGVFVSTYTELKDGVTETDVHVAFHQMYRNKEFIKYSRHLPPMIKTVQGSNFAEVTSIVQGTKCLSMCALDNLVKGAAGQAIQVANLYFGLDERTGLTRIEGGLWP